MTKIEKIMLLYNAMIGKKVIEAWLDGRWTELEYNTARETFYSNSLDPWDVSNLLRHVKIREKGKNNDER